MPRPPNYKGRNQVGTVHSPQASMSTNKISPNSNESKTLPTVGKNSRTSPLREIPGKPNDVNSTQSPVIPPKLLNLNQKNVNPSKTTSVETESFTSSNKLPKMSSNGPPSQSPPPLNLTDPKLKNTDSTKTSSVDSVSSDKLPKNPSHETGSEQDSSDLAKSDLNLPKASFANIVSGQKENPKPMISKDLAIIFDSFEDLSIFDYINGLEKEIPISEIIFASRITQNRVCFYLSSVEWVDKIVDDVGGIYVGSRFISVRRLLRRTEKIILSNVSPVLPNIVIIQAMESFTKIVSPMTYLGISKDPKLAHIKSFRRQIFIEKQRATIPNSFLVSFDGEEHRIFINCSETQNKCFKCNSDQHFSKNCPSQLQKRLKNISLEEKPNESQTPALQTDNELRQTSHPSDEPEAHEKTPELINSQLLSTKDEQKERGKPEETDTVNPFSSSDHESSGIDPIPETPSITKNSSSITALQTEPKRKRNKTPPSTDQPRSKEPKREKMKTMEETAKLEKAVKKVLRDSDYVTLSESDVLSILSDTKNSKKPLEIVSYYIAESGYKNFAKFLVETSTLDLPRSLKNRLNRLANTLRENVDLSSSDNEMFSDNSTN